MSNVIQLDSHRPAPDPLVAEIRAALGEGVDWDAETQGPLTLAEAPRPEPPPRADHPPGVLDLCHARAHRRDAAVLERQRGAAPDAAAAGCGGPGRVGPVVTPAGPETDTQAGRPVEETTR